VLKDNIDAAVASGDAKRLANAVHLGALAGVDHDLTRDVRVRMEAQRKEDARLERVRDRIDATRFSRRIRLAKEALVRARACVSIEETTVAAAKVTRLIDEAVTFDKSRRPVELLSLIGTSKKELEELPERPEVLATATYVPDLSGGTATAQTRQMREVSGLPRFTRQRTVELDSGRKVPVTQRHVVRKLLTAGSSVREPVVEPPKAAITYHKGTEYGDAPFLYLFDDRYAFQATIDGALVTLMGAGQFASMGRLKDWLHGWWSYHPITADEGVCNIPFVGSFQRGLIGPDALVGWGEKLTAAVRRLNAEALHEDFITIARIRAGWQKNEFEQVQA
ncbi:MAG: hypothetical protein AAB431_01830, partial [Patescibacteria group bacterium]